LDLAVSFPFGYGLSYTTFEFSHLRVSLKDGLITVLVKVTNTGQQVGREVVQVYTSKQDSKIDRPVKELKAFAKTKNLKPDEVVTLTLTIPVSELSYWSEINSTWELEKGTYDLQICSSSRNINLSSTIDIN
jgi:beta-glucosidase